MPSGLAQAGPEEDVTFAGLDRARSERPRPAPPARCRPRGGDVAERLRTLKQLRQENLISEEEYLEKKRRIPDEL